MRMGAGPEGIAVTLDFNEDTAHCTLILEGHSMPYPGGQSTGTITWNFHPDGVTNGEMTVVTDQGATGGGMWTFTVTGL